MPGSPYTDLDRPPLNPRNLQRALITPDGLWTRLDVRRETASTNADAAEAARAGEPEGLIVVAERQSAGRGRLGRTWTSPPRAGIATSVLLRPGAAAPDRGWRPVSPTGYGWLPLLAGVALVEAVSRLAELPAELKWPNDLLVNGAKCAGILAEAVPNGDVPAVVLGIGLNVTLRADELPRNPTGLPATSLQLAGAVATDRDPLLRALLRGIERWYGRWRAAGGDARASGLREAYMEHCGTLGRDVRAILPSGEELTGLATAVDPDGRLVIEAGGAGHPIAAADILHLR
ncbi:BirA family transcriptional regulator, biotin operon repressor / biotin-[acetyl-CoA-carboxylase] ligase [Micromonospora pattaloongensis]|uniref:biotin--[biotin carboxyl-carrier protein] ligase n=1 Tax=Micromonospora pattaloongensis TaxID=405436 RepID=A0A1H3GDL5_9ACTN|nr:biotin--[acetyl-CoA-carboxylase] ligase [Micromonospora pattaloongensis]SDY00594.1 BirA family transcriptional regulator, biotin operon repressor / biotin-[acetyl-CoA-carboxylase] ligase [Micromonospora pattaloongensis]